MTDPNVIGFFINVKIMYYIRVLKVMEKHVTRQKVYKKVSRPTHEIFNTFLKRPSELFENVITRIRILWTFATFLYQSNMELHQL